MSRKQAINRANPPRSFVGPGVLAVDVDDDMVVVDSSAGPVTLTLPLATALFPNWIVIKCTNAGINPVTVQTQAGELIDGAGTSRLLSTNNAYLILKSDSAGWQIVSDVGSIPVTSYYYARNAANAVVDVPAFTNLTYWDTVPAPAGSLRIGGSAPGVAVPGGFAVPVDGLYKVSFNVAYEGNNTRFNLRARTAINGVQTTGPDAQGGYLRNNTGHNEASVHMAQDVVEATAGDVLGVNVIQISGSAPVMTSLAGTSSLTIELLST